MANSIVPLGEIIPGVRFTVIDGVQYLSVRDLIMVMCNKTNQEAARTLGRMMSESFKSEIECFLSFFKFPGRGHSDQPVIQLQGALKLLMWLPGDRAKSLRSSVSELLTRYIEGDETLISEIQDNKSIGPIAASEKFVTSTMSSIKRKREVMPQSSWIYGTQSNAFPGLIKIGRSKNTKARLSSGNTFCAPDPHVIIAAAPTFNATRDEDAAHIFFNEFRVAGEFFKISESSLKDYFMQVTTQQYQRDLAELVSTL